MRPGHLIRVGRMAVAIAIAAITLPAQAEFKPSRDVEFVIPYGLGGGADLLARTLIKIITEEKLVPVSIVAVNKPGGGSAAGVGYVVASKAGDAHTLVLINPQTQITPLRVPEAKGWRDMTPVINFMLDDYVVMVVAASPYKTAGDLVNFAKSKPPRTVSVSSAGTADDMAIAVFQAATGIELNIVRFNSGGEAITAALGGHVDLVVGNPLEAVGQLQGKALRALGVMRSTRFEGLPDIPTMKEQGIEVAPFQMWRGVAVPKDTPQDAVAYWQGIMQKVAATDAFKKYLSDNMAAQETITGADFTKFLESQEALYKDMLARIGKK
jgi:putative tricarboxylic transport membrane protein